MKYLSPQIEAWVKKNSKSDQGLVKKGHSCGIFQDYEGNRVAENTSKSK